MTKLKLGAIADDKPAKLIYFLLASELASDCARKLSRN